MRSLLIALVLGPVVVAAGKPSTQKHVSLALPQTLRGDPAREHAFFVYPRKMRLVNRRWDTHAHPRDYCANYRVVKRLDNGVFECKCIPPPAHGRQRLAVAVRTATAVLILLPHGQRRSQAWRITKGTATACGVAATSIVPSLAVMGSVVFSAAFTFEAMTGGFLGSQAEFRHFLTQELLLSHLFPPVAAILIAPPVALHCVAFRYVPWWPGAMAATGGLVAASAALALHQQDLKQQHLELDLEAMVGSPTPSP